MFGRLLLALLFTALVFWMSHGILSGGRFDKEGFLDAALYASVWGVLAFVFMEATHVD